MWLPVISLPTLFLAVSNLAIVLNLIQAGIIGEELL